MAKPPFVKFYSPSEEIMKLQSNVDKAFTQNGDEISQGQLLGPIALIAGNNVIEHKLGRKIRGAMVVSNNASVNLYDNIQSSTDLTIKFTLNSSAVCSVILWVF